ncbi:MAG: carbohydrate ABC transporter substrate-binding protein, partial [Pseudomonadota bacterium]
MKILGMGTVFALTASSLVALSLAGPASAQDALRFWTTEEQPDRLAKQEELAADFEAATGISVEV